jgi:hypothetical protein
MTINRLEVSPLNSCDDNFVTITAYSSHLNGRGDITVYCQATQSTNVPIIILLHGVYGSHWVWSQLGKVEQVYQNLRQQGLSEFVLVMPSDGDHLIMLIMNLGLLKMSFRQLLILNLCVLINQIFIFLAYQWAAMAHYV